MQHGTTTRAMHGLVQIDLITGLKGRCHDQLSGGAKMTAMFAISHADAADSCK
ncbi:MAG: hypothetical protein KTR15_14715 [Phycisphaeraceae bacterium]|nr:hypothetical protein [Phycisphaeraceae bacterium]